MKYAVYILVLLSILSCGQKRGTSSLEKKTEREMASENYVDTMSLKLTDFNRQIICNGKLKAILKSELMPRHQDVLTKILVKNGQRVGKGELLAITEETLFRRELERAKRELEKAKIDLADKLITMGYSADGHDASAQIIKRAEVTSGYYAAKYALETAEQNLADCKITAPVAGKIANLDAQLHQRADKQLCTIIDDSGYDVEFYVLEAELSSISVGHSVLVSPFINDSLSVPGTITSINPSVDEKGLVKVSARVGGHNKLVDGMNVRVVCQKKVPKMFVVPKDAVVERDGYYVVFLLVGNKARWTYVDILYSNLTSHAITGCARKETVLHVGDIIITSGNLNLADDTEVKIFGS